MNYGPPTCHANYDFAYDLSKNIIENKDHDAEKLCKIAVSPHILCTLNNNNHWALIDSGSQITAISEHFYNEIKSYNKFLELPVSNIMVTTAIGKKSTSIKKQIMLELEINKCIVSHIFLIIPFLTSKIILGNDFHLSNGLIIDYWNKQIRIKNQIIPENLVLFEGNYLEKLFLSKKDDVTCIYIARTNDLKNVNNEIICEYVEDNVINNDVLSNEINEKKKENNNLQNKQNKKESINDITYENEMKNNIYDENYVEEITYEIINGKQILSNIYNISKSTINNVNADDIKKDKNNFSEQLHSIASTLTALNDQQKVFFIEFLKSFKKLFSDKPGCAVGYEHNIKLTKSNVVINKTYPVPAALQDPLEKLIDEMLCDKIIERATSPYCNPLRIVRKSDNSLRICLDARFLNQFIEDDHECPPIIAELMQKFFECILFSKIDCVYSYWQISLAKLSRPYTAFVYNGTQYQWCRVPFGLKTAGSAFIRAFNMAIENNIQNVDLSRLHIPSCIDDESDREPSDNNIKNEIANYIDDSAIATKSFIRHIKVLFILFTILLENNFTLRLEKCEFFQNKILFLGFLLSVDGIIPDPDRIQVIRDFEEPKNQKQLQQILGICNYYRRFAINHNDYITPFRDLLRKEATWSWTNEHSQAFAALKNNFINSVCLSHVIPGAQFKVICDASTLGIGGALFQIDKEENKRIISLASRCLTAAEAQYTTTELELLAIVYCVSKFRYYLIGTHFEIVTDHKGLTFLNSTVFHNSRLIRWNLLLQQYSYSVTYCKGSENIVADFLSRNPNSKFHTENNDTLKISSIHDFNSIENISNEVSSLLILALHSQDSSLKNIMQNISEKQKNDQFCQNIMNEITNKNNKKNESFQIYQNVIFHRENNSNNWRITLPTELKSQIISRIHNQLGHPGVFKTLSYMKKFYFWRFMHRDIKKFVLTCDVCQRVKYLSIAMEGPYHLVNSEYPCDLICIDYYGPLPRGRGGVEYILVILDAFSKLVRLYPVKRATTHITLKKIIENYIPDCGKPKRILSDHATQFTSPNWKNGIEKEGIKVIFSSIRHPQSNPSERVMREIGRLFRTYCSHKHTGWADHVKNIENLLNITTHYSTNYTPNELHFGKPVHDEIMKIIHFPPNVPINHEYIITLAKENIEKSFAKRSKNQKVSKIALKVGDLVLLRVRHLSKAIDKVTKKFFHLFEGPYLIRSVVGTNAYNLVDPNNNNVEKGTYNRSNLRKYYVNEEKI